MKIIDLNMTDYFQYELPEELPEWRWIRENASYVGKDNGQAGVWDFIVNINLEFDRSEIPPSIQMFIADARGQQADYILFNQGT